MRDTTLDERRVSRLLIVHNSADLYGASRSLLRLVTRLLARGVRPYVVLPEGGPLADNLRTLGVVVAVEPTLSVMTRDIYRAPGALATFLLRWPRSAWRLRRLIRRWNVQLVHSNTGVILSPALAARLAGVPHVWHIRDWFQEFGRVWPLFDRYVRWMSAVVVCVSRAIADQFTPDSRVVVVNNGIPLEEFDVDLPSLRERERARLGIDAHDVVIGVVGRIKFVRKGQEVLVAAGKQLLARGLPFRILVVGGVAPGNDSHLGRLVALVRELGLSDHVILAGEVADPRPLYAAMDVLVLPSAQPEPFGGVVLEAMAMRLPVVATAIGGSPEQVAEGETGYLVPPADADALACRLEVLIRDPGLRRRFGDAGRKRVGERFTVDVMVDRILNIYESAMTTKGR